MFNNDSHHLRRLDDAGYSPHVVKHLSRARAQTTNEIYNSKWKLFEAFAKNKFDPLRATPAQLAEFLTHLFENRGIAPTTIKGYRAAVGHVLRLSSGYDPGEDDIIRILMKSFDRQRPSCKSRVPSWDISLVLDQWSRVDDAGIPLSLLQTKTIFLLALATGARRGELWALTSNVRLTGNNPNTLVIPLDKSFTFKTQFTTKNKKFKNYIEIPMIPNEKLTSLCPVTVLLTFLERSQQFRQANQTSLFLPLREGAASTSKQLISANVVKAVTWAYREADAAMPRAVRAHDVRGMATSLSLYAGNSLEDVLEAGRWSNPHTFFKYYQKSFETLSLQRLGSFSHVACAGKIIETGRF